jgi:hypothetical protein
MITEKESKKKKSDRTRYVLSFDYAMNRLLRKRVNFAILNGFLSELLCCPIKVLEVLKILDSESEKEKLKANTSFELLFMVTYWLLPERYNFHNRRSRPAEKRQQNN